MLSQCFYGAQFQSRLTGSQRDCDSLKVTQLGSDVSRKEALYGLKRFPSHLLQRVLSVHTLRVLSPSPSRLRHQLSTFFVFLFVILFPSCQCPKGRDPVCLVHSCFPSSLNMTWAHSRCFYLLNGSFKTSSSSQCALPSSSVGSPMCWGKEAHSPLLSEGHKLSSERASSLSLFPSACPPLGPLFQAMGVLAAREQLLKGREFFVLFLTVSSEPRTEADT